MLLWQSVLRIKRRMIVSYLHIENLYRNQDILRFKECYVLEKVHGTSAHIKWVKSDDPAWAGGQLTFFPGGESYNNFVALFDQDSLKEKMALLGAEEVTVFGEAYGGKCQGMKETYGDKLRFIAFDVQIGDLWLDVPTMDKVATELGLEVVPWTLVSTDLEVLNFHRDAFSVVAERRECGSRKQREGVVLRPPIEVRKNNGDRIMSKHKGEKFEERATPQKVIDPSKLQVLEQATAIADEWVTPMRLTHVLDKLPQGLGPECTKQVIDAMVEDVTREAKGEIVDSREARAAIGKRAAQLFKERLKSALQ